MAGIISQMARASDAGLCDQAARIAAAETGVSLALLRAIMLAETGRDHDGSPAPWPWTLHSRGKGYWLGSREEAAATAQSLIDAGETNIDIGCFQINLHWHGTAFPSLDAMLEPTENARHAARFLLELYDQTGDWRSAAGAYHSRDADRAETYVARLVSMNAESRVAPDPVPDPQPDPQSDPQLVSQPGPRGLAGQANGPIIILGALPEPLIGGLR